MKGTIVGSIIRLIRIFLRFDHFPGPQYGADRFRMGLFYGSNARIGQIPGGFYTAARPYLRTTSIFPIIGPLQALSGVPCPFIRTDPSFSPIVMPLLVFSTRTGLPHRFSDHPGLSSLLDPVRLSLPQLVNNFLNCVRQSVFDYPGYFFFFAPINRILRGPSSAVKDSLSRRRSLQ